MALRRKPKVAEPDTTELVELEEAKAEPVKIEPAPKVESHKYHRLFNVNGRNMTVTTYIADGTSPHEQINQFLTALKAACEKKWGSGKLTMVTGRRYRWR